MTSLNGPKDRRYNYSPGHTLAEFKVKHMMISNVKGQSSKVTGSLDLDESALANSDVEGMIGAISLETCDLSAMRI
jgi:polyisoprenoid-binding protein YceI